MEISDYSNLKIEEQIKFFKDIQKFITNFVKKKLKDNYTKIKQIIAEEILRDFGWSLNNYYDIEKLWPENMQLLIDKVEINSNIKIKISFINNEFMLVYVFYKVEVLDKIEYELNSEVVFIDDGFINKCYFPNDINKKFKQIENKFSLYNIDWQEKLNQSEINYYD